MKEFNDYDIAAQRFYSSLDLAPSPLLSWEFYASHFDDFSNGLRDIDMLKSLAKQNKWFSAPNFENTVLKEKQIVVVTDTQLNIVHATHNIFGMNGYHPREVIGKKPKIFQGKDTCSITSKQIGQAIKEERPFEATIVNYRKNGSSYKCWIKGEPVYNAKNEVVNFIAYEKEVA